MGLNTSSKLERKTKSREQKEAEKDRQFAIRQEKKKAKHRGRYPHETLSGNSTDPGRDARLILSALAEGKRLTLSSFADAGE